MKFKKLHSWNLSPKEAIKVQEELRRKIKFSKFKHKPKLVAGADVTFKRNIALGVVVVLSLPDFRLTERVHKTYKINFPYIPGLLTFREGEVLGKCFRALKSKPDVIIFDGQGIAHPRNMGLATHLGILLDKTTIGCAKSWLYGDYKIPPPRRGAFSYLTEKNNRMIGAVLRTKDNVKPVYVSPGNKIDIAGIIKLILMCTRKYRLPEPLRLAHSLARLERQKI